MASAGLNDVVTREYTINLHKRLFGVQFKKRAPKAVKEIKKFAKLHMGTEDVRLDPKLNMAVWKRGIKGVPFRMRLRISRKRNEDEDAKYKLFSYVEPVNVPTVKGLETVVIEEDDEE
ncbi:60S ribosomal protein L31-B [Komagataella phaffii CBS 7435]|uniref:Protein component of the large (60S) ribosomal subunit n=3 Tax=Komagataella TaxID=460517 RepID=C4R731_KOMPG|nr:60S ribosomal protein L31 [Komagataella phaffii GS115]ANZ75862.1 BA75_03132T0 [Komagataella pastoris]AOA65312.1 GQ67_04495T0 [Komagataella phaffii]KAI0461452.1 60S ribosomal protein L31 [Komagataella kurtzmanii]CAH2451225.1 60S ribosomal protein L31-B [Komagataella phaffii CBS 7435]AOA69876.1 GQ68_04467T0 [Komagataella phaffii GS115]